MLVSGLLPAVVLGAMAPKSASEKVTDPGRSEPLWVTAAAARIDRVGLEFERLRDRALLLAETPGAHDDPDDIDTPAARVRGMRGADAGVGVAQWPTDSVSELAALRMAGASPRGFAPWRRAMMVAGRPVVAPLFTCEHELMPISDGFTYDRLISKYDISSLVLASANKNVPRRFGRPLC